MTRAFVVALLALSLLVPVSAAGVSDPSPAGPEGTTAKKKKKKCKKGYVRKKVRIKKGRNKGKRVSKCVKRKKKAAPLIPANGVYAGGSGPTEVRLLVGFDYEPKPGEDGDGIGARLSFPPGTMTCQTPSGQLPNDQPFRTNWEAGVTSRKAGTFSGSDSFSGVSTTLKGRFLKGKRVQLTVTASGFTAHSKGGTCSGTASRDVTYTRQSDGSYETP